MTSFTRHVCLAAAALLLGGGSLVRPLRAQSSTRTEFWPEVDLYVGLNDRSRLFFRYSATREDELRTYANGQIAGYLDIYTLPFFRQILRDHPDTARDKLLMFRLGYSYSRTPGAPSKRSVDHTPTLEAISRFPLPLGLTLSDRNRVDLRISNGDLSPRYRNRPRLDRTIKTGIFTLTPYADTEVFYEWQYHKFNEVRFQTGMEWSISRFLILDLYYTRQHSTTSTPNFVNALGGKLELFLRNRRD